MQLLEPIGGTTMIPALPKLDTFFAYINTLWPWLSGMAAGVAVFMAMVGGIQVMISGGDQAARQSGLDRLYWSLFGLLILVFGTFILRTLNPSFYI
ncbi:MAG: hypothetical protein Q7R81_00795 [Candidatus Peregrinibacteria bacterium]|nr:hypothetical protein [Candidatus Peregrinibacteria bacterium]